MWNIYRSRHARARQARSPPGDPRPDGAPHAVDARAAARLRHRPADSSRSAATTSSSTRAPSTSRSSGSRSAAGSGRSGVSRRTTGARASTPSPRPARSSSPRKPRTGNALPPWSDACSPIGELTHELRLPIDLVTPAIARSQGSSRSSIRRRADHTPRAADRRGPQAGIVRSGRAARGPPQTRRAGRASRTASRRARLAARRCDSRRTRGTASG